MSAHFDYQGGVIPETGDGGVEKDIMDIVESVNKKRGQRQYVNFTGQDPSFSNYERE